MDYDTDRADLQSVRTNCKRATMKTNQKVNLIMLLLGIVAAVMIILGVRNNMLPPILTGVGFFLIIWAFQVLKQQK